MRLQRHVSALRSLPMLVEDGARASEIERELAKLAAAKALASACLQSDTCARN